MIPGPCESEADFSLRDEPSIVYSNKGLRFYEGACLWHDKGKAILQLRKRLKTKKSLLFGLYSKQELLDHEMVHANRLLFNEPIFEEILAYRTSRKRFRRYFGPLFRTPKESLFFLGIIAGSVLYLPLISVASIFLIRLIWAQSHFHRALSKIHDEQLMLYLTDREILNFAKWPEESIEAYLREEPSFRMERFRSAASFEKYFPRQAPLGT